MTTGRPKQDQRSTRRVPVNIKAKIRTLDFGQIYYGECTDLSVGGMTLQTSYVPRPDETLDVFLMPPRIAGAPAQPFSARVQVRRCHQIEAGLLYELGLTIIEVLK